MPIIAHLSKDENLQKIIAQVPFPKGKPHSDVYVELLSSIVSQQLSTKAAATIFNRFLDIFPDRYPNAEIITTLPHETLRACGLSNQKVGYIQNAAAFFLLPDNQNINWDALSDEEIIAKLTLIKGVGKWTVQMILMFTLDRPDVLPLDDLVIRQNMIKIYNVTETGKALMTRLHEIAEPWRPYRSHACRYIWRWKDEEMKMR
jgi:DNA-3-methyladenine glycosylase II